MIKTAKKKYRYRTKVKKVYSRGRSLGGGGVVGNVLDGIIVGAVQAMVPNNMLGGFADSLVPIGVGWYRKNKTLQTIGGYQLGLKIAAQFGGSGAGSVGFTGQQ